MNILIVCSGNTPNFNFEIHQAFIADQVKAIEKADATIRFHYFFVKGKGVKGYLKNFKALNNYLKQEQIHIIHAHFSLSGLLSNLQRKIPVVATFHGSDINLTKNKYISAIVQLFSKKNIFVGEKLYKKAIVKNRSCIIPCGVDFDIFKPLDTSKSREQLGFNNSVFYILFSSSFTNAIKNYTLLKEAVELLNDKNIVVLELKNYSRPQVALLMNVVNLCVMTSFSEGSPQFIKEAMACNCPVISTDVGDVREVLANTNGTFICSYEKQDLANKIKIVQKFTQRTKGRDVIIFLDNSIIAEKVIKVYREIINHN